VEDEVKAPTALVVGGIYTREGVNGEIEYATCPCLHTLAGGQVEGFFQRYKYPATSPMVQGSAELNAWTLVWNPLEHQAQLQEKLDVLAAITKLNEKPAQKVRRPRATKRK